MPISREEFEQMQEEPDDSLLNRLRDVLERYGRGEELTDDEREALAALFLWYEDEVHREASVKTSKWTKKFSLGANTMRNTKTATPHDVGAAQDLLDEIYRDQELDNQIFEMLVEIAEDSDLVQSPEQVEFEYAEGVGRLGEQLEQLFARDVQDQIDWFELAQQYVDRNGEEAFETALARTPQSAYAEVKTADNFQRDDFSEFFDGYLETALWSSHDDADESGGEPMDQNYTTEDIADECLATMRADCQKFFDQQYDLVENEIAADAVPYGPDYSQWGHVGHDFWLTRNGHGAGFWDGDYSEPAGEILTEASEAFGETDLYIGDDGLIYCS